jgi:hypothetical protein
VFAGQISHSPFVEFKINPGKHKHCDTREAPMSIVLEFLGQFKQFSSSPEIEYVPTGQELQMGA